MFFALGPWQRRQLLWVRIQAREPARRVRSSTCFKQDQAQVGKVFAFAWLNFNCLIHSNHIPSDYLAKQL